jgi:hypothetical protein
LPHERDRRARGRVAFGERDDAVEVDDGPDELVDPEAVVCEAVVDGSDGSG